MAIVAQPQGRYASLDSGMLQELVRKDPESYKEEFEERFFKFEQRMNLFNFNTHFHRNDINAIQELVTFISGVADKYSEYGPRFAKQISNVLNLSGAGLDPEIRMSFCKAMVTLRNKKVISDLEIFELFFELVKSEDKHIRKFILGALVSFIKQGSQKCADKKAESKLQNFVISKLKDSRSVIARIAQLVLIDSFRKKYWRQAKIVNAIAECVFHKSSRIQIVAMRFFLGSLKDEEGVESDDDDTDAEDGKKEEQKTLKEVAMAYRFAKKTKKRQKAFEKTKKLLTKEEKAKKESRSKYCNLEAIQMLFDPQAFIDRVFGLLESKKNEKFVIRLQQIALCARIIGVHRLQTLGFYSYLHRYIQPKQREVTRILLYAAQACHELVPPDVVENLVRVIANNFVTDRNTPEAMTVGINAIREIFTNCPFAATEELLRELCEYKRYKNKNVSMAARGLITLFRSINPKMLHRKDRGRPTEADEEAAETGPLEYGVNKTVGYIPGAEVLPIDVDSNEEQEVENSDSDASDEWVDVTDDEEGQENGKDDDAAVEDEDDEIEVSGDESDDGAEDDEWVSDDDEDEEEIDGEDLEGDENSEEEVEEPSTKENKEKKLTKGQMKTLRQKQKKEDAAAKVEKAKLISETRILSDADFRKIRAHNLKKQTGLTNAQGTRKRTNDDEKLEDEFEEKRARREGGGDGLPRLNDILHFHKKVRRQTKEERLEQAREGREGRDEFNKPKKRGPHVGRTNAEMAKNKDFRMVRQKIRGKNRQRSFRDRQQSLRKYLLRQAGRKA